MLSPIARQKAAVVLLAAISLSAATVAFAHLCNNIYGTPDRIIVKPEKPTATVAGSDEFRVFVQNNYHTFLNNVRLAAKADSDALDVAITPESIKSMKAGERQSFHVKLTAKPGTKPTKCSLTFSISADNIGFRPVEEVKTEALQEVLKKEGNLSATIQAAESLVARKDPEGSKYLTNIVSNRGSGRDYQTRAIRALGKGGDRANIRFLRSVLQDQDGFLKGNALLALGLLKDDPGTFARFLRDRDQFVAASARAGYVMAGMRDKAVLNQLKQDLQSTDVYVRIACAWGLASRRDKDAVAVLDKDFDTGDAMQRVTAGDALVDIANRR